MMKSRREVVDTLWSKGLMQFIVWFYELASFYRSAIEGKRQKGSSWLTIIKTKPGIRRELTIDSIYYIFPY